MEAEILKSMSAGVRGLALPAPKDLREKLVRNAKGVKWKSRNVDALKGLVWHQELGWGSVEAVALYHTSKDSHLAKGGVESIAYTWAIRRDGQVVLCNDFGRATWSQGYKDRPGDENAEFMSVMYEGLFRGEHVTDPSAGEPNEEQLLAGLILWRICKQAWGWHSDDLYGHFHFGKPSCPGSTLGTVVEAVRGNAPKPSYDFGTVQGRQQALKDLGFYKGGVDGSWGPQSKGALTAFQAANDLAADGVWGPQTEAAVLRALKAKG